MKNNFFEYYSYTEKEFSKIWNKCIFIPDASVLLGFYRYTPETYKNLLNIFKQIKDRSWIPHQVAHEYHKNRLNVISEQEDVYKNIKKAIEAYRKKLSEFDKFNRHPYINTRDLTKKLIKVLEIFLGDLDKQEKEHPDLLNNDTIRNDVTNLFDGSVGTHYKADQLEKLYSEGEKRYKSETPPGYKDVKNKEGMEKYSDLVIWYQIIDKAREIKKPVIFITDDLKEDWWYIHRGKTIGPRPELIKEIRYKSGVLFHMYSSDKFLEHARDYLKDIVKVDESAIEEIQKLVSVGSLLKTVGPVISAAEKMGEYINTINRSPLISALEQSMRASAEFSKKVSPIISAISKIQATMPPLPTVALGQLIRNWDWDNEIEKEDDEDSNDDKNTKDL